MISGHIVRSTSVVMGGPTTGSSVSNGSRESPTSSSPLQIFVRAKKQINDIFLEVETYILDATKFIRSKYLYLSEYVQVA